MTKKLKLERSLNLPLLSLYGLGNILGAGIYVLVGKVSGFAGSGTTLAFIIAMAVATVTAFSYMELSARYPFSASVSVYLHKAFGKRWLSVSAGLAMVVGGIASASALSQGFAGYLTSFIHLPQDVVAVGLIILIGLIAIKGMEASAKTAALFTSVEVLGLLLVIWFGKDALGSVSISKVVAIDPVLGVSGLVAGTFLAFYAFIGFEDMANVAEEVKNPRRTMPIAILIALAVSTLLYVLIVVIATTIVPSSELAASKAPLTLVFERSGANGTLILSLIGMVAVMNGIIVQLIMCSRTLYGLAEQKWLPNYFAKVHPKFRTPANATIVIVGIMVVATVILPLVSLAQITSLLILSIFVLVNASLIAVKRSNPEHGSYISVPMFVPYLGALLCLTLIGYQIWHWS